MQKLISILKTNVPFLISYFAGIIFFILIIGLYNIKTWEINTYAFGTLVGLGFSIALELIRLYSKMYDFELELKNQKFEPIKTTRLREQLREQLLEDFKTEMKKFENSQSMIRNENFTVVKKW